MLIADLSIGYPNQVVLRVKFLADISSAENRSLSDFRPRRRFGFVERHATDELADFAKLDRARLHHLGNMSASATTASVAAASSCRSRSSVTFGCFVKLFILLDLPIAAGGEVVLVGLHLVLGDPELAAELVDLRLQRGRCGIGVRQVRPRPSRGRRGPCRRRLGDDLLELQPVDDGVVFEAVLLERGDLLLQVGQALGALLLELRVAPVIPAVQHVGDVVLGDLLALVVQRKAVVLHVVEPDVLGRAALGEEQHGGGDAGVGPEDAGGHRDDAVEPVLLDELLADLDVGVGGAEQHAVGHDDGGAAAVLQQAQEEVQEEDLGLLALGRQRGVHVGRVDRALERRVGEDHVVGPLFGEGLGERVGVAEVGRGDAVQHEVHAADAEHGHAGVVVVAGEGLGLAELVFFLGELAAGQAVGLALLVVGEVARVGVGFQEVLPGVDEEAAGAGGRVADALAWARVDHLDHHADDVARRAELAVLAGGVELAEQVLVEVALHVLVLRRDLHVVDGLAGLDQQAGLVDLELGVFHLRGEGAARAAERLDEGEDVLLDVLERLVGGKLGPVRPAEVWRSGKRGVNFLPRSLAARSASCSRSSSRLRKSRKESCSMASSGLESPPDQSLSQRASTAERSVVSVSMVLGGQRFGEVEKVADFLRGEEAFDRVAAEVGQRWVVEVGLDQRALCEEDLLHGPKKANLVGVVVVGLNVSLEAALHHLRVVGDGIEGEQVAEESEEVVHA